MAQEFWSDKPLKITISGKSPNNSGIPKIDITGEKGIICGRTITSTETSVNRTVSNSAAGSSANSVSTKFYASCKWDNPRTLTTNVNTYGNYPGSGKSTGNIKVKVWWDSVKKGDSSDDTYVEHTISNVTIKNAVETIDITGLSYSNGNPIPFKNGAYALDGYNEYNGIYVNYRLKGEYHESTTASSTNLTYMPIYDSIVRVNINNAYYDSYTCVPAGTVEQYTIDGKYFIPTKFNESTSAASTNGSIGAGSIDGGDIVGPGDIVATPFPVGTFQIMLQAYGGYMKPSTAVTLDVAGFEPKLVIESFTFSDSTENTSGMPTIVFGGGVNPAYVNVSYSGTDIEVDSDTGQIDSDLLTLLFEDSVDRYKIGEVTATCTFGTQTVEQTVDVYMAASIVSYIKFTPIGNGTDRVRIVLNSGDSTPAITSVPIIYYSSTTGKNFQQAEVTNNGQWYEFSKERPMYIYGFNPRGFSKGENLYAQFQFDGPSKFNISGNIMGLIDGFSEVTTIPSSYCFYSAFSVAGSLILSIKNLKLPAISLQQNCYRQMFKGCSSITAAPELPAMATKNYCYESMFMGCTSLISAPELPATTTTMYCYQNMFNRCSALVDGPTVLPATIIAGAAYYSMFEGCTSLKNAPYIAGTDNSAWGGTVSMFKGCKSLVECPEFSFEKVGANACREMFMNCYELINAPKILPATTLADNCYTAMFYNCYKIKFAPELPAKNLIKECYHTMFAECHSLRYVKALFTTNITKDTNYTYNWLYKVNTTGVVVKAVDAKWSLSGTSGIPANWDYAYNYSNNEMEIIARINTGGNPTADIGLSDYVDGDNDSSDHTTITLYKSINYNLPTNSFNNNLKAFVVSPYIQSINAQAFVPKTLLYGDKAMHLILVDMRDAGKETGDDESYLNVLGDRAFAGNNVLKRVFLPRSINTKGNDIFYGCSQLTEIWYDGTIEEYNENIGTTTFGVLININCKIICTDGDIAVSYS